VPDKGNAFIFAFAHFMSAHSFESLSTATHYGRLCSSERKETVYILVA
jgi:hypothetical protein